MAIDYRKTAQMLVDELGGSDNIINAAHCATRLRFVLKDENIVDKEKVSKIPGVITTVLAGGQFQVVIGNHVKDAYQYVTELITINENAAVTGGKKPNLFNLLIDVISSIFAPFLYTLAACGILQGILGIFVACGADTSNGTYRILNFVSWTAFTFLPVLISITASKKFGMNTYVAVVIACALVCPDYIEMVNAGESITIIGIPVMLLSYTSSVIPIILAIWAASYVEKFFNKILPLVVRSLFSAMLTIAVMVPLTLLLFGPIGNTIGGTIGNAYNALYNLSPIVAGIIVGGLWEIFVIFGVHWGITPVTVGNYSALGYDTFTGMQASAVFSQAGATLGVLLKTKNKEMKKIAGSAAVTGLFGITEPAIYGVNLRLKRPMICGCIAGAVGGAVAGGFNAVSWSYNMPGIATIPAYFKAGHATQFIGFLISIIVSFVLGAFLTYITGFKDEANPDGNNSIEEKTTDKIKPETKAVRTFKIAAPVTGKSIPIREVHDDVFSSETLGKGVGIYPEIGKIYAPFDGTVEMLTDTNHAIGLRSDDDTAVLIHVGIDTVKLEGKGFSPVVANNAHFKKGDLLLEFSLEQIIKAGFDPTVMFIATELENDSVVDVVTGSVKALENVMTVSEVK